MSDAEARLWQAIEEYASARCMGDADLALRRKARVQALLRRLTAKRVR